MRLHICPACKRRGVTVTQDRPDEFHCKLCPWSASLTDKAAIAALSALVTNTPPRTKDVSIGLTDQAWAWLTQTGHALGYIRASGNARGVAYFVAALSNLTYTDTRPANLLSTDQWWLGYEMPRRRGINVPSDVASNYQALALAHGIAPRRSQKGVIYGLRTRVGTYPDTYGANAYVSAVLEAIGLRWLSALHLPHAPPMLWRTKPPKPPRARRTW